jgi:uncharacterized protein YjiS (DUF1127 family)
MVPQQMPAPNLLRPSAPPLLRPSAQGRGRHATAAAVRFAAAFARGLINATDKFYLWIERYRQRRALISLSDHMLKDLGLSRCDAGRESGKRFWEG